MKERLDDSRIRKGDLLIEELRTKLLGHIEREDAFLEDFHEHVTKEEVFQAKSTVDRAQIHETLLGIRKTLLGETLDGTESGLVYTHVQIKTMLKFIMVLIPVAMALLGIYLHYKFGGG